MSTAVLCIRPEPHYRCNAFTEGLKRLGYDIIHRQNPDPRFRPPVATICWCCGTRSAATMRRWRTSGRSWRHRDRRRERLPAADRQDLLRAGHTATTARVGSQSAPMTASPSSASRSSLRAMMASTSQCASSGHRLAADGPVHQAGGRRWSPPCNGTRRSLVRLMAHPGDKGKLEKDLAAMAGARSVVIWSSAIGVRALVEGVPVQHFAPHWICEKWGDSREVALQRMAHAQWHFDEIASGEPFARMKAEGWGPRWH